VTSSDASSNRDLSTVNCKSKIGAFKSEIESATMSETSSQPPQRQTLEITDEIEGPPAYESHDFRPSYRHSASLQSSTSSVTQPTKGLLGSGGDGTTNTPYSSHARPHSQVGSQEISGYARVDPMMAEPQHDDPGCCFSDTGGCCFSSNSGCCFSANNACCFSDHNACCFSDHDACCFSDHDACCFSDHDGCCFSDHGGRCFSDNKASWCNLVTVRMHATGHVEADADVR
jgi:hypothetical protein